VVRKLGEKVESKVTLNLPAVKTFKIRAYFNIDGGSSDLSLRAKRGNLILVPDNGNNISTIDRAVINELQQDLPLNEKPFDLISARLSMDADEFLNRCQALLQSGIMRRFSASVNHNKLGFTANAMACWKVPSDMVETAGKKIATFPEVSHCYERRANSLWPHNLFAMIHARTEETCRAIGDKICSQTGLDRNGLILLFSTKEVKKTRIRYTV